MNPLKNNTQRARAVNIIFFVLLVLDLATLVSNIMQVRLLESFKSGNIDMEAATSNDARVSAIAIGYLIALICSAVFFIMWFRRAYNNLHLTQTENMKYSEGWAAGAWFVPFLNLYRPYEIMIEIWEKTQEATRNLLSYKKSTLVGWWWAIYIISNVASNIASKLFLSTGTPSIDSLISTNYYQIYSNIIEVPAIIITIIMVKRMSEMETKLYDYFDNIESVQEDLIGVV